MRKIDLKQTAAGVLTWDNGECVLWGRPSMAAPPQRRSAFDFVDQLDTIPLTLFVRWNRGPEGVDGDIEDKAARTPRTPNQHAA
jgi:hypothetical protein